VGVTDNVKRYTERQQTAYEHSLEIRSAYGCLAFADTGVRDSLEEFMSAGVDPCRGRGGAVRAGESVAATERMLLPGVSVLARLVSSVREEADQRAPTRAGGGGPGATDRLPTRSTYLSMSEVPCRTASAFVGECR